MHIYISLYTHRASGMLAYFKFFTKTMGNAAGSDRVSLCCVYGRVLIGLTRFTDKVILKLKFAVNGQ